MCVDVDLPHRPRKVWLTTSREIETVPRAGIADPESELPGSLSEPALHDLGTVVYESYPEVAYHFRRPGDPHSRREGQLRRHRRTPATQLASVDRE